MLIFNILPATRGATFQILHIANKEENLFFMKELERFDVQELNAEEMGELNGGVALPPWVKGAGLLSLLAWVDTNWKDIKSGIKSGWEAGASK